MFEQGLMVGIFLATLLGLIKFQQNPERVFAFATLACLGSSLVSTDELLSNATNSGLVTLLLLIMCSFSLERTSFLRNVAARLITKNVKASYAKVLLSTAFASAILNNTAVVATLITPIKNNKFIHPGKLLLPLSYAAILGGTLTLVGTSTNLIVNSMVIKSGMPSIKFFDFTLIGAVALLTCLVVLLFGLKRLPNTGIKTKTNADYFVEAKVQDGAKLIGKTIEENGLRNLESLFLVEIVRDGYLISPVSPDEHLHAGDKLIFTGDISKVLVLQQFDGLKLFAGQDGLLRDNLTEVLVKPEASIVGLTLKQATFRARFDAAVVAIKREGSVLTGKLSELVIQPGDFLVLAVGNDFKTRANLSKNFFILSGIKPDDMLSGKRDTFTLVGFLLAIGCSVVFDVSLLKMLLFYVAGLFSFKCLTLNEVKRRFPLELWLIVAGALTLSTGLENSGVATLIGDGVADIVNGKSVFIAFVAIYLITLLLTELVTNNAAAALIFPIAFNMAIGLGVNPMPFIMAVAFAASGSFISPYGYQTNVMVYNAGNYKLTDFLNVGIPVSIAYSFVVVCMIPWVFPF